MTKRQFQAASAKLIDVKAEEEKDWSEEVLTLRRTCRLLDKGAALYGLRRVESRLANQDPIAGPIWVGYWRRWRKGEHVHLVPWTVISEPHWGADMVAMDIAFTPQLGRAAA